MKKYEKVAMLLAIRASEDIYVMPRTPEEVLKLYKKKADLFSDEELKDLWKTKNKVLSEREE